MAAKEPGQATYEAWIRRYFMAGHRACDSWPDLAERERAARAAAEQTAAERAWDKGYEQALLWAQGSLSLHPTNPYRLPKGPTK